MNLKNLFILFLFLLFCLILPTSFSAEDSKTNPYDMISKDGEVIKFDDYTRNLTPQKNIEIKSQDPIYDKNTLQDVSTYSIIMN
ncbi:hypothetical protein AQ616_17655 [Oceanobacillus sp. E9]|uniref:hypothetical protein n=1 Tax=Oceanobacillus sp. E9 TaxID=1742575 RepID=UPI00084E70BC|nr:hypothetical protein [Oceanobacillus sp. E9]OEH53106.1 hypothetical protein AQ616_17655 [Oceanobacillus sp. E9]